VFVDSQLVVKIKKVLGVIAWKHFDAAFCPKTKDEKFKKQKDY
jgi:hypothetical protein